MKVMLLGLDCAIGPRWRDYAQRGLLPVTKRLMDDGAYAEHCLSPLPTLTTTNWTTIATGAWPGTHGITDFNVHKPGNELTDCPQAFDSRDCTAETLWNAAARAGKRTILMNYPVSLPPVLENGIQVGGAGCEVTDWRIGSPAEETRIHVAAEQLFSTEGEPLATQVSWPPGATELRFSFAYEEAARPVAAEIGVVATLEPGSCTLQVSGGENAVDLVAGSWSPTVTREVRVAGEADRASFRFKLMECDPARRVFRLYVTDLCSITGLEFPPGALGDSTRFDGLPLAGVGYNAYTLGWIDLATFVECLDMSTRWQEQASVHLLSTEPWDIYFAHFHTIDWFYHLASAKLDAALTGDVERLEFEAAELAIYQSMDTAIGRILDTADEPPLTVIVSDHGATSFTRFPPTRQILIDAGLVVTADENVNDPVAYYTPLERVDWSRTRAIPQRSCWVYVNLMGRDPQGIVEPEDYVAVQEEIIDAMLAYRDPDTGICPYSLVLRKSDARILGLYGDRIGDVVYAIREEFGDEHGQTLATGEKPNGGGSLRCAFLASGPGIKRGVTISRNVWLTDVAPTICHAARLPMPADAEGAVIYQLFENPDQLLDDVARAEANVEKLTNVVRRRQALTHEYS